MSREVCQSCGKVSVGFVENHFQTSSRAQAVDEAIRSFGSGSSVD